MTACSAFHKGYPSPRGIECIRFMLTNPFRIIHFEKYIIDVIPKKDDQLLFSSTVAGVVEFQISAPPLFPGL